MMIVRRVGSTEDVPLFRKQEPLSQRRDKRPSSVSPTPGRDRCHERGRRARGREISIPRRCPTVPGCSRIPPFRKKLQVSLATASQEDAERSRGKEPEIGVTREKRSPKRRACGVRSLSGLEEVKRSRQQRETAGAEDPAHAGTRCCINQTPLGSCRVLKRSPSPTRSHSSVFRVARIKRREPQHRNWRCGQSQTQGFWRHALSSAWQISSREAAATRGGLSIPHRLQHLTSSRSFALLSRTWDQEI